MFNVNFIQIIKALLPTFLRNARRIDWLLVLIKPLRGISINLKAFRLDTQYRLSFNAKKIYMEHYLRDKYDPVSRLLYIENTATVKYLYLWRKIENQNPFYLYRNWKSSASYILDQYISFDIKTIKTKIYKALGSSTNDIPDQSPNLWKEEDDIVYFKHQNEYNDGNFEFIVWMPQNIYNNIDINKLKSDINIYKPVGRRYQIKPF